VALEGFGMTRTRNQIVEAIPVIINEIFKTEVFLMRLPHVKILLTIFFMSAELFAVELLFIF
jgi:hypothetical protein